MGQEFGFGFHAFSDRLEAGPMKLVENQSGVVLAILGAIHGVVGSSRFISHERPPAEPLVYRASGFPKEACPPQPEVVVLGECFRLGNNGTGGGHIPARVLALGAKHGVPQVPGHAQGPQCMRTRRVLNVVEIMMNVVEIMMVEIANHQPSVNLAIFEQPEVEQSSHSHGSIPNVRTRRGVPEASITAEHRSLRLE